MGQAQGPPINMSLCMPRTRDVLTCTSRVSSDVTAEVCQCSVGSRFIASKGLSPSTRAQTRISIVGPRRYTKTHSTYRRERRQSRPTRWINNAVCCTNKYTSRPIGLLWLCLHQAELIRWQVLYTVGLRSVTFLYQDSDGEINQPVNQNVFT